MLTSIITSTSESKSNIIYAGFPGPREAKIAQMPMKWEIYPATPEGKTKAIQDGYQAISHYEFSHPVERDKPQPIRYGDFILDFDASKPENDENGHETGKTGDIHRSLTAVRNFVSVLKSEYGVNPYMLRYYASGGKGFHVVIPRQIIGSEDGDVRLPRIYREMLNKMLSVPNMIRNKEMLDSNTYNALDSGKRNLMHDYCIDENMFKGGKGQLLRLPHIQRPDGNYKVPVSYDEISINDAAYFIEIVKADRELPPTAICTDPERTPALEALFLECKKFTSGLENRGNAFQAINDLENKCSFLQFCKEKASKVTEPQWFLLARIFVQYGTEGCKLFHEYSRMDSVRYNPDETNAKLRNAVRYSIPTCEEVNKSYTCGKNCGVKCPSDLFRRAHADSICLESFDSTDEGILYFPNKDDRDIYEKVCSSINIKASARDADSASWSKIVEVTDLDNIVHPCRIPYQALNGRGEEALDILSEAGLRLEPGKHAKTRLLHYLKAVQPDMRARIVDKNGWLDASCKKFSPFDLGDQRDGSEYLCLRIPVVSQHFSTAGTLAEWREHIGVQALGNPIMQLVCVAALAGPGLLPLNEQGFGIHLHSGTSRGKTTMLSVAASVTGGEMGSWRTTDNALEAIAERHSDNCLLLDEISQCDPDAVAQVAYMLANGKGKSRSTKTGGSRRISEWNLLFLSTGEESIRERADQGYRNKSMPGHEVRVISLRADGGTEHGVFTAIPDDMAANEFADKLKKESGKYYGTPLISFIEKIKIQPDLLATEASRSRMAFLDTYDHLNLKAHALRVAGHFSFLAGVGEFAIKHEILPWSAGDALKAVKFCFDQWLSDNNNGNDLIIQKSIEKLISLVMNDFYGRWGDGHPVKKKEESGRKCFFIPRNYIVHELCKGSEYDEFVSSLKERGLLVLKKNGEIKTQMWDGQANSTRGIIVIIDKINTMSTAYSCEEISSSDREIVF